MSDLRWNYGARTDVGGVRDHNEDAYHAGKRLIAVADGVGGAAAGEVASALTIGEIARLARHDPANAAAQFNAAIDNARSQIRDHIENNPESTGMATTLTALWIKDAEAHLVHIGDSRAYLLRDDDFVQITTDDSYVQHLLDEGAITKAEAAKHPYRSAVTRVIQANELPHAYFTRPVREGDRVVVCSDGVTDYVSEELLESTLRNCELPQDAADALVKHAYTEGAPDNVTAVVADVESTPSRLGRLLLAAGATLGIAAVVAVVWFLLRG
ncbi:PP2C family protein-serine/threonine phosphatase [Haloglycomyces albus]|uniref:PP2C family protein-serine/threonine phosphatase n=1 Tax=Haloglycomyces albus TaxID=526067 RepID=UPI00046CDBDE|nr:protein phosphatase 2C domain-containing protein [Haloglycomyces albus]